MSFHLGIDTSNYTTSVAIYDDIQNKVISRKKLLPVKPGEKGIRQSDAVFHHTIQLPELIHELFSGFDGNISSVGVSVKPCNTEGSYMPCFLAGISVASSLADAMKIPLYKFSHQDGHIAAALFSADKLSLIQTPFFAFHISGGTSQALLVEPFNAYFKTSLISDSLDLKAGQAVDRVGLMLGLAFPCGPQLEKLALKSTMPLKKIKVFRRDGCFSLSGVENKCKKLLEDGEKYEDIALYCINYIRCAIDGTVTEIRKNYGDLPMIFSGGVMSNSIIRSDFEKRYGGYFAEPEFSADNACGTAVLSSICHKAGE